MAGAYRAARGAPTCLPRRADRPSSLDQSQRSLESAGANPASPFPYGARPACLPIVSGTRVCNCLSGHFAGFDVRLCSGVRHPDFHPEGGDGVGHGDGRTCYLGCSFFSFCLRVTAGWLGEPSPRTHANSPASNHALRSQPAPLAHRRTLYTFYRRSWSFSGAAFRGATQCFPHRSCQARFPQIASTFPPSPPLLTGGSQPAIRA